MLKKDFKEFQYPWNEAPVGGKRISDMSIEKIIDALNNLINLEIDETKTDYDTISQNKGIFDKLKAKYLEQKLDFFDAELKKIPEAKKPDEESLYKRIDVMGNNARKLQQFFDDIKLKFIELSKLKDKVHGTDLTDDTAINKVMAFDAEYDVYKTLDELIGS